MKTLTSREFNQDVSRAKRLARIEPVFITDRGRPTHVLLGIGAFRQLAGQTDNIVDLLAMPEDAAPAPVGRRDWDRTR
ncbi:type II toxin-antitoxin system Phd/YefM family antitoxin [Sphingomonas sp. CFBP8993]|uniref:type II toxin-antitoxin system Phd/YefM family antitoxin n=1 Tax=Sphingomonas sp. CFBP8993 TaxID=3096526 RepID=UPI002A6A6D05|nr:type II toxin-antitoxin system Phd/YefM family antitoxin [Sphingomonas sp. CFBP8993]MDY0957116.1 type II toxin-antitoxin system Phd/YefM family antitoxin [Sphingomonas sp. CFBP8993]